MEATAQARRAAGRPATRRSAYSATVLLILGVAERAVMGIMGWSNSAVLARYQHLAAQVRRDIAQRVEGLHWDSPTEDATSTS